MKVYQNAVLWINLKSAEDKGLAFWQTQFNAIIFHNSVPADRLEKSAEEIPFQKTHLSPRLSPKVILRNAWQVRHNDYDQRGASAGQLAADEVAIQGISRAEVEQEEEKSQKQLVGKTCA